MKSLKKLLATGLAAATVVAVPMKSEARCHWGHGGRYFWPGFVGGLAAGAFYRPYYYTPYVVPAVYTYPTVTYSTATITTAQPVQQQTVTQPVQQQPVAQPAQQQPVAQPAPIQLREGETMIIKPDGTRIITKNRIDISQTVEAQNVRQ